MFKAKYGSLTHDGDFYWRTIICDDLREADRIANRWIKKGWYLLSVVQEMFND